MATIKENIYTLSELAQQNGWSFDMWSNQAAHMQYPYYRDKVWEDCPVSNPVNRPVPNPCVIASRGICSELEEAQRTAITDLGFEMVTQCFWVSNNPDQEGWSGYSGCIIRKNGADITLDQMWVPEMKQVALQHGIDVRDYNVAGYFPWGAWGATKETVSAELMKLINLGLGGSFVRHDYPGGGYIYLPYILYIQSIYKMLNACTCGDWVNDECVSQTERRQIRVCTPAGCDLEEQIVPDATCATPCTCDPQWTPGDCISDTHRRMTRACVPAGCAAEVLDVPDPSCASPAPSAILPLALLGGSALLGMLLMRRK